MATKRRTSHGDKLEHKLQALYEKAVLDEKKLARYTPEYKDLVTETQDIRKQLELLLKEKRKDVTSPSKQVITKDSIHQEHSKHPSPSFVDNERIDPLLLQAISQKLDGHHSHSQEETLDNYHTAHIPEFPESTTFIPTFFLWPCSDVVSLLKQAFKLRLTEEESTKLSSYLVHLDIALLYGVSILLDLTKALPFRLEWLVFLGLSIISFSSAIIENRILGFTILTSMATLVSLLCILHYSIPFLGIYVYPFLVSVISQFYVIMFLRMDDPNAHSQWILFIILDLLFKRQPTTWMEWSLCSYTLVYCLFMGFVQVNAGGVLQAQQNEASGVEGFSVDGKPIHAWSWDSLQSKLFAKLETDSQEKFGAKPETMSESRAFFSNHWKRNDRFEISVFNVTANSVSVFYTIPYSFAVTLYSAGSPSNKVFSEQEGKIYNITAQVNEAPPFYISKDELVIQINGKIWVDFHLDCNTRSIIINGLLSGKSYKIQAILLGYSSISCRVLTTCPSGNFCI